jgi:hypothetical protein
MYLQGQNILDIRSKSSRPLTSLIHPSPYKDLLKMTTNFSSLPIVDLAPLSHATPSESSLKRLSEQLRDVFSTVGFAYLINPPLSFSHRDVFDVGKEFFGIEHSEKVKVAKKIFVEGNANTYRGYVLRGHFNIVLMVSWKRLDDFPFASPVSDLNVSNT